jgi:hypothetical protein
MPTCGRSISPRACAPTSATRILDRYVQSSPGGRYVLYVRDDHYWTVDLASGRHTNITAPIDTSFVDRESDDLSVQKPPFGVAGWSRDDRTVLLYDKHDVWAIAPDGTRADRLTDGRAADVRYRYVRLDPDEEWIDQSQPLMVSQFGLRSKKSGYARVAPPAARRPPPPSPRWSGWTSAWTGSPEPSAPTVSSTRCRRSTTRPTTSSAASGSPTPRR